MIFYVFRGYCRILNGWFNVVQRPDFLPDVVITIDTDESKIVSWEEKKNNVKNNMNFYLNELNTRELPRKLMRIIYLNLRWN